MIAAEDTAVTATGPAAANPPAGSRDPVLDALRTLAVLLMVASHTTRLVVWEVRRDWSRWSLIIEPFTASLFLILVGASVVQSFRKAQSRGVPRAAWLRRQGIRFGLLWAVSIVFYSVSEGFLLPDAVFLSGILCTIGYAGMAASLLLAAPRPALALGLFAVPLVAAYAWLDLREERIFVLNAGNSPLFPLGLFAVLGALLALAADSRSRLLKGALVLAASATLAFLLSRHPFHELFTKPVGRFETARVFLIGPEEAKVEKTIPYYNLRINLAAAVLSLAVLAYALLAALRPLLRKPAAWLFRLGRRSLDAYILHLALLAIFVTTGGKRPLKEAWQGDAVFLGVLLTCYLWVWGRDAFASRRAARAAAAASAIP